jgi:hypothetical protein
MARTPGLPTAPVSIRHRWRFAVVLVASLLLAVAQPLMSGLFDDQSSFDVFFSLLIVAVLLLVFEEREHRRIATSLGLAAFLGIWVSHGFGGLAGRVLLVGAHLLAAGFFVFALYGILRAIFVKQASGDAIFVVTFSWGLSGAFYTPLSRQLLRDPLTCQRRETPMFWLRDRTAVLSVTIASLPWPRWDMATSRRRHRWPGRWPGWRLLPVSFTLRSWWQDLWDSK